MARSCVSILLAGSLVLGLFALDAHAVIISTPTGTENTAAPADFPYWDYVSKCRVGTAVYLGNRWVLTASHVGPSSVTFAGTAYGPVSGSTIRIKNSDGTPADMVLFRINGDPGLSMLPLARSGPAKDNQVTMIGASYKRQADLVTWGSSWETPTQYPYFSGYFWDTSDKVMRWGTNTVSEVWRRIDDPVYGNTNSYNMNYDTSTGNEAMAAPGDSGGGVFFLDTDNTWRLQGLMLGIQGIAGQPDNTSVFGNTTKSADLYKYIKQLTPRDGDANSDGNVDVADYTAWFNNYGSGTTLAQGDFNSDNRVDVADYVLWFNNYGAGTSNLAMPAGAGDGTAIPEPVSAVVLLAGLAMISLGRGRKKTYTSR